MRPNVEFGFGLWEGVFQIRSSEFLRKQNFKIIADKVPAQKSADVSRCRHRNILVFEPLTEAAVVCRSKRHRGWVNRVSSAHAYINTLQRTNAVDVDHSGHHDAGDIPNVFRQIPP